MIQWGRHLGTLNTWNSVEVYFPTAFPQEVWFVSVHRLNLALNNFSENLSNVDVRYNTASNQCANVTTTSMLVGLRYDIMYLALGC